jgi:hypothetical protein
MFDTLIDGIFLDVSTWLKVHHWYIHMVGMLIDAHGWHVDGGI